MKYRPRITKVRSYAMINMPRSDREDREHWLKMRGYMCKACGRLLAAGAWCPLHGRPT